MGHGAFIIFDKQAPFVNLWAERWWFYDCVAVKGVEAEAGLSLLLWDSLNVNF
jgi:hypothetical protein